MPAALDLPDDIETLKRLLLEERAARQADQVEIQSLMTCSPISVPREA